MENKELKKKTDDIIAQVNIYDKLAVELRKNIVEFITENCKEHGEYDLSDYDDAPMITYDGGRHPEYDSNCYSTLYRIYLNDKGKAVVETEDSDDYSLERMLLCDLIEIAHTIIAVNDDENED